MNAAAQIHFRHASPEGYAIRFPVEQRLADNHSRVTTALRIQDCGVVVEAMPDDALTRYRWLSFRIPGTNFNVRALGEFAGSSLEDGETSLTFKHIWPDAKRELERYLAAHVVPSAA